VEDQLLRDCLLRSDSGRFAYMAYEPTLPRDAARKLRGNATEAEQKLWFRLRSGQLKGFQFRRQYSVGPFFADFVCLKAKLIVEVDGSQHAEREVQDERRSAFLRSDGFRVLRFWNFESRSKWSSTLTLLPRGRRELRQYQSGRGEAIL
jgi:very-short-patch-repair endonuclease